MHGKVEFIVRRDSDGGYCACQDLGETSILTAGDNLDELYAMIEDGPRTIQERDRGGSLRVINT